MEQYETPIFDELTCEPTLELIYLGFELPIPKHWIPTRLKATVTRDRIIIEPVTDK